jgi:hypothetical protein
LDVIAFVQGIKHGKVAFAGHAKHPISAMGDEAINQQISGAAGGHGSALTFNGGCTCLE